VVYRSQSNAESGACAAGMGSVAGPSSAAPGHCNESGRPHPHADSQPLADHRCMFSALSLCARRISLRPDQ